MRREGLTLVAAWLAAAPAVAAPVVRINQVQVIGTHNSYHAGLTPQMAAALRTQSAALADGLEYSHPSLTAQLNAGVRQIELDVFADTQGGRFAHPRGADAPGAPPFDSAAMARPGFKVLHVQDVDYVSRCPTFVACLQEVRAWSHAHPRHAPLFVLVETKASTPPANPPLTAAEPFTPAVMDALDAEIRAVFRDSELVTPDLVRGGQHATLEDAVLHGGWPTLEAARGRIVFLLDQTSIGPAYLEGHAGLRGRVLFTNAQPGQADAAFVERNEGSAAEIAALVRRGYLVRTRADADTRQGRTGDATRRDEALKSGAQMVSTDYPASEPSRWTGYKVALPGGVAVRCNPVNAPAACADAALERLAPAR